MNLFFCDVPKISSNLKSDIYYLHYIFPFFRYFDGSYEGSYACGSWKNAAKIVAQNSLKCTDKIMSMLHRTPTSVEQWKALFNQCDGESLVPEEHGASTWSLDDSLELIIAKKKVSGLAARVTLVNILAGGIFQGRNKTAFLGKWGRNQLLTFQKKSVECGLRVFFPKFPRFLSIFPQFLPH